jgi:hypothetical protein
MLATHFTINLLLWFPHFGVHSAAGYSSSSQANSHLSPHFMELEISLQGLQMPTTGPCLVLDEFILHPIPD